MNSSDVIIKQHLIDPDMCIRCNSCQEHCPSNAISHNNRNYVVDAALCNTCLECMPDCPTGAIDSWRLIRKSTAYSTEEQLTWDQLPEQEPDVSFDAAALHGEIEPSVTVGRGAPPSASPPIENLYSRNKPLLATVRQNRRLTSGASEICHIALEVGQAFPFLEGQSVGIVPPGVDANGRPHMMRLYSIASARSGEGNVSGTLALTVKRTTEDSSGQPHRGVCSNHLCDLQAGDSVEVLGPYGASFLMPEDSDAHLIMIATGTGIAPMRAMIEQRLRRRDALTGKQSLFYGGRTPEELPYHAELKGIDPDFLDMSLAFSRMADQPKRYVQDLLRARHEAVAGMLADDKSYFYLCGLKGMEAGVEVAFEEVCVQHGMNWTTIRRQLHESCRLHIETY